MDLYYFKPLVLGRLLLRSVPR